MFPKRFFRRRKLALLLVLTFVLAAPPLRSADAPSILGQPVHRRPGSSGVGIRPTAALAGPTDGVAMYHVGGNLLCSDCHSVHFSESHGFSGGTVSTTGVPDGDWLGATGPNKYLLKAPSPTELCLACHDGQTFAPDVVTTDSYGVSQRPAGYFDGLESPNYKGHKISRDPNSGLGSSDLCSRCHFAGSMATAAVQCVDCHNPHGNASYRNLWWASAPGSEPPILASIRSGATGKARYEAANVAYPAPSGSSSWAEVTNMCIDCHHTFFAPWYTDNGGSPGGFSPYHRHPGLNSESGGSYPINRTTAHTDAANWVAGGVGFTIPRLPFAVAGATDFASASAVAGTNQVFCLTCHQAHGSENPFGLRWDYGSRSATGLDGCRQCHNNVFQE